MELIISPLIWLLSMVLSIYFWIIIASVILSWLSAFNVINQRNPAVKTIGEILYKLSEPVLSIARKFIPQISGIDLSPIVVILAIGMIQYFLQLLQIRLMFGKGV